MTSLIFFTGDHAAEASALGALLSDMSVDHDLRSLGDGDGVVGPADLIDAQNAPVIIVAGSGKKTDLLRSIGSANGALADGPIDQPRALVGQMGAMLGRPGLGGWLAARDAGPAFLVDWSKANGGDLLAQSAALGTDPAGLAVLLSRMGAQPASEPAVAPETSAPAAPEVIAVPPQPEGEETVAAHALWRACLPHGLIAATIGMLLFAPLFILFIFTEAPSRWGPVIAIAVTGLLLLIGATLGVRRSPALLDEGKISDGKFGDTLRFVGITAGVPTIVALLFCTAIGLVEMFKGGSAVDGVAIGLITAFGFFVFLAGAIVALLTRFAVKGLPFLSRGAPVLAGAVSVCLVAAAALYETPARRDAALQTELERTGLANCDINETDQFAAGIRGAERRFDMPETGKRSSALLVRLQSLPDKTRWVLAKDGSGDGKTLDEIMPNVCGEGEKTVSIRPGTYALGESSVVDSGVRWVGEGDRNEIIITVADDKFLSIGSGGELANVTVRATTPRTSALVSLDGDNTVLEGSAILSNGEGPALSVSIAQNVFVRGNLIRSVKAEAIIFSSLEDTPGQPLIADNDIIGGNGSAIYLNANTVRFEKNRIKGQVYVVATGKARLIDNSIVSTTPRQTLLAAYEGGTLTAENNSLSSRADAYCAWSSKKGRIIMRGNDIGACGAVGDFASVTDGALLDMSGNRGQAVSSDRVHRESGGQVKLDDKFVQRTASRQSNAPSETTPPATPSPRNVDTPRTTSQVDYTK